VANRGRSRQKGDGIESLRAALNDRAGAMRGFDRRPRHLDAVENLRQLASPRRWYAFTSAANNNGSAFAGLTGNTDWYNTAAWPWCSAGSCR
jgi:hypothetical protein